jgi:acetyl esterase/lipase
MVCIEPSSFDAGNADPQLAGATQLLLGALPGAGWVFPPSSAAALRTALSSGAPAPYLSERAETLKIPSPDDDGLTLRVIRPAGTAPPAGVYVHCHGGGWTIGSAAAQDVELERISDASGLIVASVEYRLAPEHPYPAPLDDCETALRWVIENGAGELGTGTVLAGGQSAGANLALAAALRVLKDRPGALSALALYYGNYDLTGTPSLRADAPGVMISMTAMSWFMDQYVPDHAVRARPDVSPLYADLSGLPPTALIVGSADALRDDTLFLAARLASAGVPCELHVVAGAEHGFDHLPLPAVQQATAAMDGFLARHAGR